MSVLATMTHHGCEQLIFHRDADSGLQALVAIHSTVRGPALGGTRWYAYGCEEDALRDVLRLSEAMTAKAAVANLPLGGGKAVVIGDPEGKTPAQLDAYADLIEGLAGRYITTTDVGTTTAEMDRMHERTRHVVGISQSLGGGGDTSELTAVTVIEGLQATLEAIFDDDRLDGRRIAIAGVGKVGARLARYACRQGAELVLADTRTDTVQALAEELNARICPPERIHAEPCDVFSPNALGNVLNERTIPELQCRGICGGANNQLGVDPDDADRLRARGIVYAPDYVVNSGGLINACVEYEGYDEQRARALAAGVRETTRSVLEEARRMGISTASAARALVQRRLRPTTQEE